MSWLSTVIIYYLIGYVLVGGFLVEVFGLLTWEHMSGCLFGLLIGHYLGRSSKLPANWV